MSSLPTLLYSCEQTRAIDRFAIETLGVPGNVLMKRAGRAALEIAQQVWADNKSWLVLCGAGNNAGDGYVFAALAAQKGHQVRLVYLKEPEKLGADAQSAYQYAVQEGVEMHPFVDGMRFPEQVVVVDALLGSGLKGEVLGDYRTAIENINAAPNPVLALDIPSGLNADTGKVMGAAVKAAATVTFVACKRGLLTGSGPAFSGQLFYSDLGLPSDAFKTVKGAVVHRLDRHMALTALPVRSPDAHKGDFGHVMVVGGDIGYGGAAILAAESAAHAGAGMVSLCTRQEHVSAALVRRPELMVRGVPSGQELEPHLSKSSLLVVGPGLGQTPWSEQMLQQVLQIGRPLVMDADALNIMAQRRLPWPDAQVPLVITPHPGEAARLLNCTTADVQSDRFAAARALCELSGGVVVLKGSGTLVSDDSQCWLANVGNPGLATAGTGDVLSGLIGGLMAQGLTPLQAAQLAVCVHGDAADLLVEETSVRGMLAAELIPYIRELLN